MLKMILFIGCMIAIAAAMCVYWYKIYKYEWIIAFLLENGWTPSSFFDEEGKHNSVYMERENILLDVRGLLNKSKSEIWRVYGKR